MDSPSIPPTDGFSSRPSRLQLKDVSWESKLTAVVGASGLLVLLSAQSVGGTILGRYSLRYLAVILAYALLMTVSMYVLSRRLPTLPSWLWFSAAVVGFVLIDSEPLLAHTWWLHATLTLSFTWVILATMLRLHLTLSRWGTVVLITGAVLVGISLLTLQAYPLIQPIDEGWDADLGWTFLREGLLYTRINQGIFGIPERFVPTLNALPAYWLAVAGVGLFQARLIPFWGGLILLAITYVTALRFYRRRDLALVAVLILAASYTFQFNSHRFRLDIFLGVAGTLSLYLYLRSMQRPGLALLSGFVLAAAAEIHQNAFLLCLGSGLFLIAVTGWRSLQQRRLQIDRRDVYFVIGGIGGGFLFVGLHILPAASEFMRQYSNAMGIRSETIQNSALSTFGPLGYLVRTFEDYVQVSPTETIVVTISLLLALSRRLTRPLVLLLAAIVMGYGLTTSQIVMPYLINFWPLVAVIVAGLLVSWVSRRQVVVILLAVAIAMPSFLDMIRYQHDGQNTRLLSIARQIASTIRPEEKVVALHYFFFVMPDNPHLIAPFMPEYAQIAHAPVQGLAVWQAIEPDVFIVSSALAEPDNNLASVYREQMGFVKAANYTDLGCCITVYRRPLTIKTAP